MFTHSINYLNLNTGNSFWLFLSFLNFNYFTFSSLVCFRFQITGVNYAKCKERSPCTMKVSRIARGPFNGSIPRWRGSCCRRRENRWANVVNRIHFIRFHRRRYRSSHGLPTNIPGRFPGNFFRKISLWSGFSKGEDSRRFCRSNRIIIIIIYKIIIKICFITVF